VLRRIWRNSSRGACPPRQQSADLVFCSARASDSHRRSQQLIPADARVQVVISRRDGRGAVSSVSSPIAANFSIGGRRRSQPQFAGHEAWIEQLTSMRAGQRGKWDETVKTGPIHPRALGARSKEARRNRGRRRR
jgi:hypothetical protein